MGRYDRPLQESITSSSHGPRIWLLVRPTQRNYFMNYRGPGFLAVHDVAPPPTPLPSVSPTGDTVRLRKRGHLLPGREGGGYDKRAKSIKIRPQESLVLYKSFSTLWAKQFNIWTIGAKERSLRSTEFVAQRFLGNSSLCWRCVPFMPYSTVFWEPCVSQSVMNLHRIYRKVKASLLYLQVLLCLRVVFKDWNCVEVEIV